MRAIRFIGSSLGLRSCGAVFAGNFGWIFIGGKAVICGSFKTWMAGIKSAMTKSADRSLWTIAVSAVAPYTKGGGTKRRNPVFAEWFRMQRNR